MMVVYSLADRWQSILRAQLVAPGKAFAREFFNTLLGGWNSRLCRSGGRPRACSCGLRSRSLPGSSWRRGSRRCGCGLAGRSDSGRLLAGHRISKAQRACFVFATRQDKLARINATQSPVSNFFAEMNPPRLRTGNADDGAAHLTTIEQAVEANVLEGIEGRLAVGFGGSDRRRAPVRRKQRAIEYRLVVIRRGDGGFLRTGNGKIGQDDGWRLPAPTSAIAKPKHCQRQGKHDIEHTENGHWRRFHERTRRTETVSWHVSRCAVSLLTPPIV